MKPYHVLRRRWPVLASLVAAAALAALPGEANRHGARAAEPALACAPGTESAAVATAAAVPAARPSAAPITTPGVAGRIISLDPETGQLGAPSPEQLRSLRAAAGIAAVSRTEEGLTETRLTDGTVILDLDGRYQDNVIARLDRNGRLVYGCVHDDGKPLKATRDTFPTSALEEE